MVRQIPRSTTSTSTTRIHRRYPAPRAFYNFQRPVAGQYLGQRSRPSRGVDGRLLAQDTWSATSNLTLVYGFRVDQSGVGGVPAEMCASAAISASTTANTIGRQTLPSSRASASNYTLDSELRQQFRGGGRPLPRLGTGRVVSNSFSNPAVRRRIRFSVTGGNGGVVGTQPITAGPATRRPCA